MGFMIPRFISYGVILCVGGGMGWLMSLKGSHSLQKSLQSSLVLMEKSQDYFFELLLRVYGKVDSLESQNETDLTSAQKELVQLKESLRSSLPNDDRLVQKYKAWQSSYTELSSLNCKKNMVQIHDDATNRLAQISALWQEIFRERFYQVMVDGSIERPSTSLKKQEMSVHRAQQFIQTQRMRFTAALNFLQTRFQGAYPSSATSLEWKKAMADLCEMGVLQLLIQEEPSLNEISQR